MKRRIAGIAVLLALSLVAAACGGGAQGPIKVGILMPQTGDLAFLGGPMANAGALAVDGVNEAGGLLGDREVQVVQADTRTEETASREGADKLVNVDGVPAFMGAAGSGNSFAALAVASDAEVLQVSPSSTSPDFTTEDPGNWFFRTAPSDALQGRVMAQYAYDQGFTTAATLALNNPYGEGFKNVFIETFESLGGEVVADVLFDPQTTTFSSEVQQVSDSGAEMVVLIAYPETGGAILKEAYAQGSLQAQEWLLSEGLKTDEMPDTAGQDEEGNYIMTGMRGTQPQAVGPAYEDFVAAYEEKYDDSPTGPFDAHAYDAMALILLAIEKAGAAEGPAIRDNIVSVAAPPGEKTWQIPEALEMVRDGTEIDFEGASGNVNMNEVGDVLATYEIWEVQSDGSFEIVDEVSPPSGG